MDRYIPLLTCKKAYKASNYKRNFDLNDVEIMDSSSSPERLSSPEFFTDLRYTGNYEHINYRGDNLSGQDMQLSSAESSNSTRSSVSTMTSSASSSSNLHANDRSPIMRYRLSRKKKKRRAGKIKEKNISKEVQKHKEYIARYLDFKSPERVLKFEYKTHIKSLKCNLTSDETKCLNTVPCEDFLSKINPLLQTLPPFEARYLFSNLLITDQNDGLAIFRDSKRPKSLIPYRVLDAPCLRNDFYSNLISWSRTTGNVIVGLGYSVYIWSERDGAIPVLNHNFLGLKHDLVTCLSFCPFNELFLVGTKQGRVMLFDQNRCIESYRSLGSSNQSEPLYEYQSLSCKGVSCFEWFLEDKICCDGANSAQIARLFIGEETGEVAYVEINSKISNCNVRDDYSKKGLDDLQILCLSKFQAQSQQVCGLSLNQYSKNLAVGGNDNSCTIWDISDIRSPRLVHTLPHNAAVKAVSFCPWSKSLLATGGGSKDRKIKFWHTLTGTLVKEIQTTGQITSLIWSVRYKQLVATFGFGDIDNPILLTVYSYPSLERLIHVRSSTPLRVLTAVPSSNLNAICLATNDETIRFYEIWGEDENTISEVQEAGIYNSKLIDFVEGISTHSEEYIR
ncbi:hypothetical protein B1J92_L06578g [Nakaseomyces glabratus]|nr:hypothetical protein B1J91_L06578g [Nakaseomyces glabratus]OXB46219.1 hypothetical protein B1J92_L06578g [Nakaseomyces glabratus]